MSSIVIKGNTSGQVEIAAPDVAGSTTLTLPTGTGTVITTNNIDSNPPASLSTASGSAPSYSARAWVAFTGNVNPIVIRASGNVSSISDNGVGSYSVNFSTAMPDANFCTQFMAQPTVSNAGADTFAFSPTTAKVEIRHFEAGVYRDGNYCCAVVFR